MPQVLKDQVEARIRDAALDVLADVGLPGARMNEIAARAGVSAGNLYHYFAGKQTLFDAVVPRSLAARLRRLLRQRIAAGSRAGASNDPDAVGAYAVTAEATVAFALAHRRETIILLARAEGTPHAALAGDVIALLIAGAARHWKTLHPGRPLPATLRFQLELVYRSYVRGWVALLERFPGEREFRAALAGYERYHLAGLAALLA